MTATFSPAMSRMQRSRSQIIMRGYHLARLTAQIVYVFPQPNRNSS